MDSNDFWSKVSRPAATACWLWQGHRVHGYGQCVLAGVRWRAHRAAWTLANGPIPPGLCVLHRCDVRHCVNPAHLFLGTVADNNADMVAKGRQAQGDKHGSRLYPERYARGERHGRSKLTAKQVCAIREALGSQRSIAARFGISQRQVGRIRRGTTWPTSYPLLSKIREVLG
jgi:hypothetical protein